MDLTHLHLLLNHFPTVGFIIGIAILALGLIAKSDEMKRLGLVLLLGIALLTIMVYVTGNAAESAIGNTPGVSKALMEAHEGAALRAFMLMELVGGFSWLTLWQYRRTSRIPIGNSGLILVLSIATFGLMVDASNIGGEIRHPEIRDDQANALVTTPPAERAFARRIGAFVVSAEFVWPTCETLHFIGLCLLCGIALVVDLRILGMMKDLPFTALHRLLPWGVLGFGLNLVTGFMFFIADPSQYTNGVLFFWKMAFVILAGINVIYFTTFDDAWLLKAGDDAPLSAKVVAATAIALVAGIIFCGRMLPFLGNSF